MKLRDYQEEIVQRNLDAKALGHKSTLNSVFTGAGKTIIFATMAKRIEGRTLIIAPLRELVWQAADKVRMVVGEDADIEMAEFSAPAESEFILPSKVVVACKATLLAGREENKRYKRFKDFEMVIIDEAHLQCSDKVVAMLKHFQSSGSFVAGFTATPFRMDGKPMCREGACNFTNASQQTIPLTGE